VKRVLSALLALAITLAVSRPAVAQDFATTVAARCKGEAPFAIAECACTVRNRLSAGWSEGKVLEAYYASDALPTQEEIDLVASVLDIGQGCGAEYFMWSLQDCRRLGIDDIAPLRRVVLVDGVLEVWLYEESYAARR
jgi:hypothetical protein